VTGAQGKREKKKSGSILLTKILALLPNSGSSMGQDFYYSHKSSESCRNSKEMLLADDFDNGPKGHFDLKRFIRSIQHIEGNPECFGEADGYCDRKDCQWREYCLKEK